MMQNHDVQASYPVQRIVDPDTMPTDDAKRWGRGKSPWHADAFPPELSDQAPEQGMRSDGWFELDWCGNEIGWVPDGTEIVQKEAR
jgi:hypothetical protein